jgi:hypothetical protein
MSMKFIGNGSKRFSSSMAYLLWEIQETVMRKIEMNELW